MSNKEIAQSFQLLAGLMELHGDNPFKIRSYQNAYASLRKLDKSLGEMTDSEISEIRGIGKAIVGKIRELLVKGEMNKLIEFKTNTPPGIQEMLSIKGLGAKKIKVIWKELKIESPGELLYACYENRLVEAKGFGFKTQEEIKRKIEYFQESRDKFLYAFLEDNFQGIYQQLKEVFPGKNIDYVGEIARKCPVIHSIEFLIETPVDLDLLDELKAITINQVSDESVDCTFNEIYRFKLHFAKPEGYVLAKFRLTGSPEFVNTVLKKLPSESDFKKEGDIFESAGIPYYTAELRDEESVLDISDPCLDQLISLQDITGILHNHSTYSDGLHTLQEMATYVRDSGYMYFGISDHSKTAVYAGGLQPEDVYRQLEEIDQLNTQLYPFRIFKGIESDILNDGSLDYEEDILKKFDFIVASIHSNLNMDIDKATRRLITAIENPNTKILGHATGRLLLSRKGYPIHHDAVIDACAANGVAIELNANPLRLDMDFSWIPYAMEKNVLISINPDAHSKESIHNVRYGVMAARKGMLTREFCLNAKNLEDFEKWVNQS